MRQLCLHSVTQPYTTCPRWREQGGGGAFPPLGYDRREMYSIAKSVHCIPALYRVPIHSPEWGDKVDYYIGFSYRPVRLHRLAGRYDNPMP